MLASRSNLKRYGISYSYATIYHFSFQLILTVNVQEPTDSDDQNDFIESDLELDNTDVLQPQEQDEPHNYKVIMYV